MAAEGSKRSTQEYSLGGKKTLNQERCLLCCGGGKEESLDLGGFGGDEGWKTRNASVGIGPHGKMRDQAGKPQPKCNW